jgi:trans-aconitate 2-methyltransferase
MENSVQSFYDEFTTKQLDAGISLRNLKIQEFTEKFGLKDTDNVLEIGCGIGTQTELLVKFVANGKVTAVDISPKSIHFAKERLKAFRNVEFLTGDINEMHFPADKKFDVIVLPDVIEHIPLENHFKMFAKLRDVIKDSGFVIIHIPNPNYLEWSHVHDKASLQIIDQPIYTDVLCSNTYPNDFYIHHLHTYEIWKWNCDYQVIILKVRSAANHFAFKYIEPTFMQKAIYKLKLVLGLKK